MALPIPYVPETPTEETLEEKKVGAARDIAELSQLHWVRMMDVYQTGLDLVWHNNRGLTPQQVCDELGTSAAATFYAHGLLADFLRALYAVNFPGDTLPLPLPTNAFTAHEDGTVTVLEGAYEPA